MATQTFEKEVLRKLESIQETLKKVEEALPDMDKLLSSEEEKLLADSYEHQRRGKLLTHQELEEELKR